MHLGKSSHPANTDAQICHNLSIFSWFRLKKGLQNSNASLIPINASWAGYYIEALKRLLKGVTNWKTQFQKN